MTATLCTLDDLYVCGVDDRCNETDELLLRAVALQDETWNGWDVPLVTADEFRRYISVWAWNDPNGRWVPEGVVEGDGALIYRDGESDDDVWSVAGIIDGKPVYALSGWTWLIIEAH